MADDEEHQEIVTYVTSGHNEIQYIEEDADDPHLQGEEGETTVVQVLQTIPIGGLDQENILNDYVIQNSDGNLTYIIQNVEELPEGHTLKVEMPDDEHYMEDEVEEEEGEEQHEMKVLTADHIEYEVEEDEEEEEDVGEDAPAPDGDDDSLDNEDDDKEEQENQCLLCKRSFATVEKLRRHVTVTHSSNHAALVKSDDEDQLSLQLCVCCGEPSDLGHTTGDIECADCPARFVEPNNLARHRSIEHPAREGHYPCAECRKELSSKSLLIEHMRIHPAKAIKCKGCDREFTRKYHLERHLYHTGCMSTVKKAFECRVCKKLFTRKDNLAEHLRGHAGQVNQRKQFKCEYCKKTFKGMPLLNVHLRTHTGERPFGCDFCEKRFASSGAQKKHRRIHTGEKPYKCSYCAKTFAAKETLNRHTRVHTGDKPHVCKFCGKAFIQPTQLRAHIFHHTGENAYTCPHCDRAFNRKLRLTTHIKYVHEGVKPLQCDLCDKTFFRKEDLARHTLSHTGEKPFECPECAKRFASKSALRIHSNTHKKEQPCSCDTCGRAFIRQDCLMRHMRARHRDVLADIMAGAEKRRMHRQLVQAAAEAAANNRGLGASAVWTELQLTDSIKELLTLLVDDECLKELGYPDTPIDKLLDAVIKRCGHQPASQQQYSYVGRLRENAKLLFTVVIDDDAVKELLNTQTVEEVITHVLQLADKASEASALMKMEQEEEMEEEQIEEEEEEVVEEQVEYVMEEEEEEIEGVVEEEDEEEEDA